MSFPFIRPMNIHPSAAGTIPAAINWPDVFWDDGLIQGGTISRQITGIGGSINIEIQPGTGSIPTIYYQVTSSELSGTHTLQPPTSPWISVTSNTTISVNNNEWLSFITYGFGFGTRTATIVNKSNGDTVLDTFNYGVITS